MNRKQKMNKLSAKRAKAKKNKHTAPTIKKYISKGDRAKMLAQEQAESALQSDKAQANADQEPQQLSEPQSDEK